MIRSSSTIEEVTQTTARLTSPMLCTHTTVRRYASQVCREAAKHFGVVATYQNDVWSQATQLANKLDQARAASTRFVRPSAMAGTSWAVSREVARPSRRCRSLLGSKRSAFSAGIRVVTCRSAPPTPRSGTMWTTRSRLSRRLHVREQPCRHRGCSPHAPGESDGTSIRHGRCGHTSRTPTSARGLAVTARPPTHSSV